MDQKDVVRDDPAVLEAEAKARAERIAEDDRRRFALTLAMFQNGDSTDSYAAHNAVRRLRADQRSDEIDGATDRLSWSKESLVNYLACIEESNRYLDKSNEALRARVADLEAQLAKAKGGAA